MLPITFNVGVRFCSNLPVILSLLVTYKLTSIIAISRGRHICLVSIIKVAWMRKHLVLFFIWWPSRIKALDVEAFILFDFGKDYPHSSGKPDTFPYLVEGLLSLRKVYTCRRFEARELRFASGTLRFWQTTGLPFNTFMPIRYLNARYSLRLCFLPVGWQSGANTFSLYRFLFLSNRLTSFESLGLRVFFII